MHSVHRYAAACRRLLARRPWIRGGAVLLLSLTAGLLAEARLTAAETAGREWGRRVDVVVASRALGSGATIAAGDVEVAEWPAAIAPRSALRVLPIGAVLRTALQPGDPVVAAAVASEPGERRVVVPVQGWPSLKVGDRVDVLLLAAHDPLGGESWNSVLAPDVVLATGARVTAVFDDGVEVAAASVAVGRIAQGVIDQRVALTAWTDDG